MRSLLREEVERGGPVVQIRLLGGVQATTDAGEPIDLGPPKCQAVLASLALSAGSAIPVPRLVELVWGGDPPRTAEKTLQSYVTRLRKDLGAESVARVGAAYRLTLPPESVDVERFKRHIAGGNTDAALQEWQGTPLAGLHVEGLAASIDGLIEQWLGAKEADLGHLVEDDPSAAVAPLMELTAEHPFREGLWALLMTALYRDDRQADALAVYGRARRHLVDELGVEPGPRLQEVEALVLAHDNRLDRHRPDPAAVAVPSGTVTFGFSDIEASSRLWAANRKQMAVAVARHDEIQRSIATANHGYVFATGGDSFAVAFHRAGDASRWASALQQAVGDERWPQDTPIQIRIGLHTGEPEERADDYFGPVVNTAARIMAAGHGGQTLVSDVTAALLANQGLVDLGRARFDDLGAELQIFQLGDGDFPQLRIDGSLGGNLPKRTGRLYGRDIEVETLGRAIAEGSLVTIVGPGGIGKTRLALAAARFAEADFGDGAWLVELADIGSSSDVARAVVEVLDVNQKPGISPVDSVIAHLQNRQMLLVLDNCEHVIDGAAELATAVADGCPGVTILATSREGLGLAYEQLIVAGPLDTDGPAIELFAERARSSDPTFDLDTERAAVVEICRRLDGVPLAIELAAARVRTLPPGDLVGRLDDRLRLLTGGRRRSVERHRTLRATIQWSYDLLTPAEQMLFRRLSIFAGSFDLAGVEAVTADADLAIEEVNGLLGDLVERSMVGVESGAYGRRFRVLETMRQFAAERLSDAGGSEAIAARHAAFIVEEVERLGALLASNKEIEGATRLSELWPNLRAAVDWGFTVDDRELVASLLRPIALQMFVRRGLGEIAEWAERLLAITPSDDEDAIAWGILWITLHYSMTQEREHLRELIDRYGAQDHLFVRYSAVVGIEDDDFVALDLGPQVVDEMRSRGEETYARMFQISTAAVLMTSGQFDKADAAQSELAELFRAEGPPSFLGWSLFLLGASAAFRGDLQLADRYWEESISTAVPPRTNSPNETLTARAAFRQGNHVEAYRILAGYVDELSEVENMAGVAMVGIEFVNMMAANGRLADAGVILGHFEATGLLGVEGPGFKMLVTEALEVVTADPEGDAALTDAAARNLDEHAALEYMGDVLTGLIQEGD